MILISICVLFLDQLTKYLALAKLSPGNSFSVIKNVFHLTLVYNSGSAFGLFKNGRIIFIFLAFFAVIFIARYLISKKDIYRVSVLIVKNSKNEMLLARRSLNKNKNPGLWGPSVAGINAIDESYIDNILKETEEEIGLLISDYELKLIEKKFVDEKDSRFFVSIFLINVKDFNNFKIQKEEVDSVDWFSKSKLEKELKGN